MSFLKKQAINTQTVQEGCKGIEQFFFPISLFGILFSIFFYFFDRLEMVLRIIFLVFFRLKALESLEKLKFLA